MSRIHCPSLSVTRSVGVRVVSDPGGGGGGVTHLCAVGRGERVCGSLDIVMGGQELPDGYVLSTPAPGADRRTAAEKRHDELMAKKEGERVKKWAAKSHRERINEFNNYLQDLSEHHDIPKVGPG
eukprot:jgi/Botrbrau1/20150/Bobra.0173s0052.1